MNDPVNHPKHYTKHPSGVECIEIVEHMNFCRGNAIKYIWRAGEKGEEIEDLRKAQWYLEREIARLGRERMAKKVPQEIGKTVGGTAVPPNPSNGEDRVILRYETTQGER